MAGRSDGPSSARYLVHDGKDMVIMLGVVLFMLAGVSTWLSVSAGLSIVAARVWLRFKRRDDGFATRKGLAVHLAESAVIARGPVVRPSLTSHRSG